MTYIQISILRFLPILPTWRITPLSKSFVVYPISTGMDELKSYSPVTGIVG